MTDTTNKKQDPAPGTLIKSDELIQLEREINGRLAIAKLEQTPVPADTVAYRSETDPATGRIKLIPITQLDLNDQLVDEYQERADAQNRMIQAEEDAKADDARNVESLLTATERRINLERYFTPILKDLTAKHIEACDRVTEFESDEIRFRAIIQNNWAFEGKHPDVKRLYSSGPHHFKHMLTSGDFNIEGYKLADQRGTTGNASIVFLIPSSVNSLMSFSDSPEAKEFSQNEYQRDLERLITKRKQAALKLNENKKAAREALAAIPSFDDLISDSVKRALRK